MATMIDKLEAEKRQLVAHRERLDRQAKKLQEDYGKLEHEEERIKNCILAEKLKELIGKPVRIRYRVHSSDRHAWMNDAVGTLLELNHTTCLVDYGDIGKEHDEDECSERELPIRDVVAAVERRPVLHRAVERVLGKLSEPQAA